MFLGTESTSVKMGLKCVKTVVKIPKLTASWQLDEIQLLTLFWTSAMGWNEWVHERLEIGPPPLSQRVTNNPLIIDAFARKLRSDWG